MPLKREQTSAEVHHQEGDHAYFGVTVAVTTSAASEIAIILSAGNSADGLCGEKKSPIEMAKGISVTHECNETDVTRRRTPHKLIK